MASFRDDFSCLAWKPAGETKQFGVYRRVRRRWRFNNRSSSLAVSLWLFSRHSTAHSPSTRVLADTCYFKTPTTTILYHTVWYTGNSCVFRVKEAHRTFTSRTIDCLGRKLCRTDRVQCCSNRSGTLYLYGARVYSGTEC